MNLFRTKLLALAVLLVAWSALGRESDDKRFDHFPAAIADALRSPEKAILYSLEAYEKPVGTADAFRGFKLLGQVELSGEEAQRAGAAFLATEAPAIIPMCFEPRHGISVTHRGKTFDLALCFACGQTAVFQGKAIVAIVGAQGTSKAINAFLRKAKVPISKSDQEEMALHRVKSPEELWHDAMPAAIRPLWSSVASDPRSGNLEPMRTALEKALPDPKQRAVVLFTWLGTSNGSWEWFPVYERVAERLLLTIPTSDLVAASESDGGTLLATEGAARLFSSEAFTETRPDDAKNLPATLRRKLLEHGLANPIEDNQARARQVFGTGSP